MLLRLAELLRVRGAASLGQCSAGKMVATAARPCVELSTLIGMLAVSYRFFCSK